MGSGAEVFNQVVNQQGSPALFSATLANRPAFGYTGRIFIATDTREIYRDTGTSWELIGSGAGSVNIYNSDGTLLSARILTMGANNLTFSGNDNTVFSFRNTGNSSAYNYTLSATYTRAQIVGQSVTAWIYSNPQSTTQGGIARPGVGFVTDTGVNMSLGTTRATAGGGVYYYAGQNGTNSFHRWFYNNIETMRLTNLSLLINTTVQDVYTVDVNGNLRLTGSSNIGIQCESGKNNFFETNNTQSSLFGNYSVYGSLTQNLSAGGSSSGGNFYGGGVFVGINNFVGNYTYGSATINAAALSGSTINFNAAGTLTVNQAGLRAAAGHIVFNSFGGTNSGTITHFAGMQILGLYNINTGTITPTITNAFGLVINNLNDYSHTFTLTNRWGLYQTGGSDNNYLAGKLLVGTTTVTARQVHISGNIELTTTLSGSAGGSSGQHLSIWANGTEYKIALLNP